MSVELQLDIFTSMGIEPTIAMRRGDAYLSQCAQCGTLVAVPSPPKPNELGACPMCGEAKWWRQDYHSVGPFRITHRYRPDDEAVA